MNRHGATAMPSCARGRQAPSAVTCGADEVGAGALGLLHFETA
ncbi:hypothetical protein SZ55_1639 [Pseudomonas sp. FeS53a]|nr:hypothetical protein SZ55_1639 [Pseudomonas sp. FeS53a]